MSIQEQAICDKAPSLPPVEQMKLWADETEDRLNVYENGEMEAIPASEVFRADFKTPP